MPTNAKRLMALVLVLNLSPVAASGGSGLTTREKGGLVGGAAGAGLGAAVGAAAGNAVLGAIVGAPVGLVGGYLIGDKVFHNASGRRNGR